MSADLASFGLDLLSLAREAACVARRLQRAIRQSSLPVGVHVHDFQVSLAACFRVSFSESQLQVSVLVPHDAPYVFAELALVAGSELVNRSALGYEQPRRFESLHEVLEELRRLSGLARDGQLV